MSIKMIAAVSKNGVIGNKITNTIPWSYPEDMKFFRAATSSKDERTSVVIMGRKTFESIGSKPLPKRRNIVITRADLNNGIETYVALWEAIELGCASINADIWLIGGESIYREGLKYADEIFLTLIPETIDGDVYFPWINPDIFSIHEYITLEGDKGIKVAHYIKPLHQD